MIEPLVKRDARPLILGLLVVLLCSVCPLLASCQTTKNPDNLRKVAAPPRPSKQVRLKQSKPLIERPVIEVARSIDAREVKLRAGSYPPVFENGSAELLNGYYRVEYYNLIPPDAVDEVIYVVDIGHYVNGLQQGEWTTHYILPEQGLDYTETYKDDLEHGPVIVYKPDKQVLYQTTFENGNGMWKLFYPNTKLRLEGTLKGGRRQGMWREYDEQGQLVKEELFENGELVPTK